MKQPSEEWKDLPQEEQNRRGKQLLNICRAVDLIAALKLLTWERGLDKISCQMANLERELTVFVPGKGRSSPSSAALEELMREHNRLARLVQQGSTATWALNMKLDMIEDAFPELVDEEFNRLVGRERGLSLDEVNS